MSKTQAPEKLIPFSSQLPSALLERVKREADNRGLKLYKALIEMAEGWLKTNGKGTR